MGSDTRYSRRRFAVAAATGVAGVALGGEVKVAAAAASANVIPSDARFAIIDLIARYAWGYDTNSPALFASTFTADGVLEIFGSVKAKGQQALRDFLNEAVTMRGDHGWQHRTDHHQFRDYTGTACTVYSYYLMPESDAKGGNVSLRAMGYYIGHCVKQRGQWLFARREVHRWNGQLPWTE
jgi:SnoaL-like domain